MSWTEAQLHSLFSDIPEDAIKLQGKFRKNIF